MSELSEILTCSVCLGRLKSPKRLPCGHCFCLTCLEKVRSKTCPECRKEFYGQPKNLPCDFKIRQLLDVLEKESKSCFECQSAEKVDKCSHCPNSYCELCQLQHWNSICSIRRRLLRNSMYGFNDYGQLREHYRAVMIESLRNAQRECRHLVDLHFKEKLKQAEREPYFMILERRFADGCNELSKRSPRSLSLAELRRFAQCLTGVANEIEKNCKGAVVRLGKVEGEVRRLEEIFPRPGVPKFPDPRRDDPLDKAAGTRRQAWAPVDRADTLVDETMGVHSFHIRPTNTRPPMTSRHQSITCMDIYRDHSLEELRWEDYRIERPVHAAKEPKFPLEPLIFPSSTILLDSHSQTETVHVLTKETQTESAYSFLTTSSEPENEFVSMNGYTNLNLYLLSQKYPTKAVISSENDDNKPDHKKANQRIVDIEKLAKHPLFESLAEEERAQSTIDLSNIMCSFESKLFVWQGSTATLHQLDVETGEGHVSFRCNEPPLFSISEITMNAEGNTVALCGPEGVACMLLDGEDFTTSESVQCPGTTLELSGHNVSSSVLKIVLQPDSYGKRMYVLLSDARFLVWDVVKNESIVEVEVTKVSKEKRALGELLVSFDVVGNECDLYEDCAIRQVIILLENGNIILIGIKSYPKDVGLLEITKPLKVLPSGLELDFCIDACSVLTFSDTSDDILVLATKSGLFYHCMLVWSGGEKIVSVVEMFEIETVDCSRKIHLTKSTNGYLIGHGSGIYQVTIPWINLRRDQLTERELDEHKFKVVQLTSETAIGITQYYDGQVVYLSDSYRCRCPEVESRKTFQNEISEILEKSTMKLMPEIENLDTKCSPEEAFRIETDAIAALKENYVSKQEIALLAITTKFATLEAERMRQQKDLIDLEKLRTTLTVNYDKLERRKSLAFFRYKQIIKRILDLSASIHDFRTKANDERRSVIEQKRTLGDQKQSSTLEELPSESEGCKSTDEKPVISVGQLESDDIAVTSSGDNSGHAGVVEKEATVDKVDSDRSHLEKEEDETKSEEIDSEPNVELLPERDHEKTTSPIKGPPCASMQQNDNSLVTESEVQVKEPESRSGDIDATLKAKDTDSDENEACSNVEPGYVSHFDKEEEKAKGV